MSKTFQKTKEDFICENCGFKVSGTGYTNHCPNCLYSKHVDIFPGDRSEKCGGLMEPIAFDSKDIYFKCLKCNQIRRNRFSPKDNRELLIKISPNPIPSKVK